MLALFVLLLLSTLLIACSGTGDEGAFADQNHTVKVLYYDEQQFYRDYGELIMARYQNLDIEVISTGGLYPSEPDPDFNYDEALLKLIEDTNPDVLMLAESQYRNYYEEGRLLDLEPLIERDKFDIETVAPGILQLLRDNAGGTLHGLAPQFYNDALYYNIDLFDAYNIPHPTDQMTWEEIFMLAQRFPVDDGGVDDRIYGYTIGEYARPSDLLQRIAVTEGMVFVDPLQKQVTVQGDDWNRIFSMIVDLYRSDAVPEPVDPNERFSGAMSFEDFLMRHPFTAGRAAMTIDGPYLLNNLKDIADRLPERVFQYGLVTAPVDPKNPDRGGNMSVYNIFAVHAESTQVDAAWEVVKFINSEDMARIKSRSSYELLSRTTQSERFGVNIEAFYKLNPQSMQNLYEGFDDLPPSFFGTFYGLIQTELQAAIDGNKTVAEAVETLQTEGQKALLAAEMEEPEPSPPFGEVEVIEIGPMAEPGDGEAVETEQ